MSRLAPDAPPRWAASDPSHLAPPLSDIARFGKTVKLTAFKPFTSAANALEQINAISESQLTDDLKNFLELNLPKVRGEDT